MLPINLIEDISCTETVQQEDRKTFKSGLRWISVAEIKLNPSMSKLWYSGLVNDTTINHVLGIWGKIFLDSTLVRPGYEDTTFKYNYHGPPHNEHRRAICRAEFNGCMYPGEAWYDYNSFNENGNPWCHIITETGAESIVETIRYFSFEPSTICSLFLIWDLYQI